MTDIELAAKYKIPERSATNWRVKLSGARPKGAKAILDPLPTPSPTAPEQQEED